MKKLLYLIFGIFIIIIFSMTAFAASNTTDICLTEFYVQRFGAQMDEDGNITSRDTKYFTPILYESYLEKGSRDKRYSIVYKDGEISSDNVINEVIDKPNDIDVIAKIKNIYESKGGQILSSNGKIVSWNKFTIDNYELRWYVLKFESSSWHIDGVIVEKETSLPIEIQLPDEPGYVKDVYNYISNFAYIYGYDDKTMAADNNLRRSEVSAMIHRLVKQNNELGDFIYNENSEPAFDDIRGEWFRSGIEYINHKGAFTQNKNVYPYVNVTRGEAFKIICLGLDFTDKTDLGYDEYAEILYNAGYIQGDENGDLNIWNLITRAEFCTIYNKIIGRDDAKLITADGAAITAETYGFTDLDSDKWYYEIMLKATSSYDNDGYVNIELRNKRNYLDDYQ